MEVRDQFCDFEIAQGPDQETDGKSSDGNQGYACTRGVLLTQITMIASGGEELADVTVDQFGPLMNYPVIRVRNAADSEIGDKFLESVKIGGD